MCDDRLYESREVAEILGVPPGQIAKWKHDERAAPVAFARRQGHYIPLWDLSVFTTPNWVGKGDGRSLVEEYRDNVAARRKRDT